jgi:tetratricopeptide (TPR) repeat protein
MHLLAMALRRKNRVAEALSLDEEAWLLSKEKQGADHYDTLWYLSGLAQSYFLAKQPEKAMLLYNEYLAWTGQIYRSNPPRLARSQAGVGYAFLKFGQFADAEKVLRACLTIREKIEADLWRTFDTQSQLGAALLGQQKYAEAEPLLVQGYEGLQQRAAKIPPPVRTLRLTEALERLVQLYDATGQKDKAEEWRKQLEATKGQKQN